MRGVHPRTVENRRCRRGSSPHARGPPVAAWPVSSATRIIPACAGSTVPQVSAMHIIWDHPRMRGVHEWAGAKWVCDWGSSPHARGPLRPNLPGPPLWRIIPACAGSTVSGWLAVLLNGDHPRMRGVHLSFLSFVVGGSGSSPHARGPLHHFAALVADYRIIPACAGSTFFALPVNNFF